MSPRKPRPLALVDVSQLDEYLTLRDIADLMNVDQLYASSYARVTVSFPRPAFHRRRVWRRSAILSYLRTKPRLLARGGAQSQFDSEGNPLLGVQVPEYLTRDHIATLLDVLPRHISDAAYQDLTFPPAAFGNATVLFATDEVLRFLRRRELGSTWQFDESVLDPELEWLSLSQIAMLAGVTDQSIRAIRFQRHRHVFPSPVINVLTGRPFRPVRFSRQDVRRYIALVNSERAARGRRRPTEVSLAFLEGA